MSADRELERAVGVVREEYGRRAVAPELAGAYSFLNAAHAALVFDREAALLQALGRHLRLPLDEAEVLDVGCGVGTSLALLAAYGCQAARLHGVDIDEGRIERGRNQFPGLDLRVTNGYDFEFEDASFDAVQQVTMLSSVHSEELRRRLASEMERVLRPGGLLLSYDVAPAPVAARALNRALSHVGRRGRPSPGHAADQPAVRLTPVQPLAEEELRGLFAGTEALEAVRLTPYRPLVERAGGYGPAFALMRRLPGFSTALLFVARRR